MKRIYLDQNHWIGLSRANRGLPSGRAHEEALLIAREGVNHDLLSFPLSHVHYMETWQYGPWEPRWALAAIMGELSRFEAIAPSWRLVPPQIDEAIIATFGHRQPARAHQVFGVGAHYALGDDSLAPASASELGLSDDQRYEYEQFVKKEWEQVILSGPAVDLPNAWFNTNAHLKVEQQYHAGETQAASELKANGWGKGDELRRVMLVKMYANLREPIAEAFSRQGLGFDALFALDEEGMTRSYDRSVASGL